MKSVCHGCNIKRTVTEYDLSNRGPGRLVNLCLSCANTVGLYDMMHTHEGKMLLQINSKLDLLLRRGKR